MSVINTNVSALQAQNAGTVNNRNLSLAMQKLSTGKRINGAADDAAGLAISNRMTAQIRGLNQAVRNANDGITLLQTAESAMIEVTNMLQRMRELAVQASNDTNSDADRDYLDLEFQQLDAEITRVRDATTWNGQQLLDGSVSAFVFQIGADNETEQRLSVQIDDIGGTAGTTGTALTTEIDITAAVPGTSAQTATIDFDAILSSLDEGDKIYLKVGDLEINYVVDADDETSNNSTATNGTAEAMLRKIASIINTSAETKDTVIASVSEDGSAVITLNGLTNNAWSLEGTYGATDSTNNLGDVQSRTNALSAIDSIDTKMDAIDTARAELGSYINRLTSTADNLSTISMNQSASRSRILDTDYASVTTELARTQIIQQAATAMLAQANQAPSTVLSLLK